MTGNGRRGPVKELPLSVRAEAAAWLASLGGPQRTPELESRFRRWLAESELHRIAWERVSDAWELAGGLASKIAPAEDAPSKDVPAENAAPAARWSRRRVLALTGSAVGLAGATGALGLLLSRGNAVSTGTGERRVLSLKDGTRITLNTDTRVLVRYDAKARRVWLERGEALFEVAKAASWPFIVTAAGHDVRALGTAFEIRRYDAREVAITLVEGRIGISPEAAGASPPLQEIRVLASPGERLTFAPDRPPALDTPPLNEIMAWQSGEVVFNHTLLSVAAREMNRYSRLRIVIADPAAGRLRLSGLFQAGDSAEFAEAVAETYRLRKTRRGNRIILATRGATRPPRT